MQRAVDNLNSFRQYKVYYMYVFCQGNFARPIALPPPRVCAQRGCYGINPLGFHGEDSLKAGFLSSAHSLKDGFLMLCTAGLKFVREGVKKKMGFLGWF